MNMRDNNGKLFFYIKDEFSKSLKKNVTNYQGK